VGIGFRIGNLSEENFLSIGEGDNAENSCELQGWNEKFPEFIPVRRVIHLSWG
jgi:hypothetical protein